MTFRERVEWIFRMALMLFILASVAFLSALLADSIYDPGTRSGGARRGWEKSGGSPADPAGPRHRHPNRRSYLQSAARRMKSCARAHPPASKVKVGQFAHVVLSLGPQKATIPLLEERSLRAARIELMRSGMQIGEISSVYLPGTANDETVLRQDPAAGKNGHHQSRT